MSRRTPARPLESPNELRGRHTGWVPKQLVARDSDGMENIEDFFESESETGEEEPANASSSTLDSISSITTSDPPSFEFADDDDGEHNVPTSPAPAVSESPTPPSPPSSRRRRRLFATPSPKRIMKSPSPSPSPPQNLREILCVKLAKLSFIHHERISRVSIHSTAPSDWTDKDKVYGARILKRAHELLTTKKRNDLTPFRINSFHLDDQIEFLETWDRRARSNLAEFFEESPSNWTDEGWLHAMRSAINVVTLKSHDKRKRAKREREEDS